MERTRARSRGLERGGARRRASALGSAPYRLLHRHRDESKSRRIAAGQARLVLEGASSPGRLRAHGRGHASRASRGQQASGLRSGAKRGKRAWKRRHRWPAELQRLAWDWRTGRHLSAASQVEGRAPCRRTSAGSGAASGGMRRTPRSLPTCPPPLGYTRLDQQVGADTLGASWLASGPCAGPPSGRDHLAFTMKKSRP